MMAAFAAFGAQESNSDTAAEKIDLVPGDNDFPKAADAAKGRGDPQSMFYRDPVGPEARYLHDADALDWLGAIGVARGLAQVDAKGGKPTAPDMIKDIENDRKNVPSRIVTPAGKAQIAPRLAEEKAFLDALRRETKDLAAL